MADLIDRAALLNGDDVCRVTEYDEAGFSMRYKAVPVEAIRQAPTIEAEPVKHGRGEPILDSVWNLPMPVLSGYRCSECGRIENEKEPYCNCGAKMDLEE